MINFTGITELMNWLHDHQINTDHWGKLQTKPLSALWEEYLSGESHILGSPPRRVVNVVAVLFRRDDSVLLEIEQELNNTSRRHRLQPPCEKMRKGESYLEAARRCLIEELGLYTTQFALVPHSYQSFTYISESNSYPGLQSEYSFHILEATSKYLSSDPFWHLNHQNQPNSIVKRHLWAWRDISTFMSTQSAHPWSGVMAHGNHTVQDSYC